MKTFSENLLTLERGRCLLGAFEAGMEIGGGRSYFPSLNLFRRLRGNLQSTNPKDFHPEQVLCSLSAGILRQIGNGRVIPKEA